MVVVFWWCFGGDTKIQSKMFSKMAKISEIRFYWTVWPSVWFQIKIIWVLKSRNITSIRNQRCIRASWWSGLSALEQTQLSLSGLMDTIPLWEVSIREFKKHSYYFHSALSAVAFFFHHITLSGHARTHWTKTEADKNKLKCLYSQIPRMLLDLLQL